jgi:hypothetical protein
MATTALTLSSPLPVRFYAWLQERFPLGQGVILFALYAGAMLTGRAMTQGGVITLSAIDVAAFFGVWAFFFMLRVFDEHKDYELDVKNHPHRVLQSGLITLGHLKVAGAIAIALQLGVSLAADRGFGLVTQIWLGVFVYALLMAKEFFIGEWLSKRLVLYAFTHMLIMPMALVWMAQMGARGVMLPGTIIGLALMSFLSGSAFEISRKLKAPADERPTVDSYTKILGTTGAPAATFVVLAAGAGVELWLLEQLTGRQPVVAAAVLAIGLAFASITLAAFAKEPSAKKAKSAETATGVAMLLDYIVLIVSLLLARGALWV